MSLRGVSEQMGRKFELGARLGFVLRSAVDLVNAAGGSISLWDETAQALVPQACSGLLDALPTREIRLGEGVVGRVAGSRSGLIVNDHGAGPGALSTAWTRSGVSASMAEPLLYRDRLIGVIHLVHTSSSATFTDQDASLLRIVVTQAAVAIQEQRSREEFGRAREQADGRLRQALAELQRAVADRETLLQEVHHRTKNNL